VLLLDPCGAILFANRYAQLLLADGGAIMASGGRLRSIDPKVTARFAQLLRAVVKTAGRSDFPPGAMALPTRSGGYLSVLVWPYRWGDGEVRPSAPAVMVFVAEQQRRTGILPGHIARLYGLSPCEARLAGALVAGRTIAEYAEAAGVTPETARGYLKSVFLKTGTNRQAALVSALLSDPILGLAAGRSRGAPQLGSRPQAVAP
jgi:DNA-binding CsgD family transcriptional regulator